MSISTALLPRNTHTELVLQIHVIRLPAQVLTELIVFLITASLNTHTKALQGIHAKINEHIYQR